MGMILDTGLLEKGLRARFMEQVANGEPGLADILATLAPSDTDDEKYGWLAESPTMQEWLDERQIKAFSDASYTITNKSWEATMAVHQDELDDDKSGAIMMRIDQLAQRAGRHPNKLVVDTVVSGTTDTGYDGVAFFSNSHTARGDQSAAQDNLLAGTGTTTAALKTDVQTAISEMKKVKDERNEPFWDEFESQNFVILCAPDLEFPLREATNAELISNTTNELRGAVGRIIASSRLTDTNDWYLFYTGGVVKPLIFQDRAGLKFEALTTGEQAFLKKRYLYGASARYNVGYGFWQFANKTVNA